MSKHTATGYDYPENFQQYLKEMYFDELLEKEEFLRNTNEESTFTELNVPYGKEYEEKFNGLWYRLLKEQKKKNNDIMNKIWSLEKDEKLFTKCEVLQKMDEEVLPTFAKVCLICLKAARDVGAERGGPNIYYRPNMMMAEALWNLNPNYPERRDNWHTLEEIPTLKDLLPPLKRYPSPKPLMDINDAVLIIQSAYRGYLVRKTAEVQELYAFWEIARLMKLYKEQEKRSIIEKIPKWNEVGRFLNIREKTKKYFTRDLKISNRTNSF